MYFCPEDENKVRALHCCCNIFILQVQFIFIAGATSGNVIKCKLKLSCSQYTNKYINLCKVFRLIYYYIHFKGILLNILLFDKVSFLGQYWCFSEFVQVFVAIFISFCIYNKDLAFLKSAIFLLKCFLFICEKFCS